MENSNPEIAELINHTAALGWSDTPPLLSPPNISHGPSSSFMLVGKILSSQSLSKATIKSNILQAWKFLKSLVAEDKGENMMVFTFESLNDLNKVLDYSPWNIKGSPLFLKRWSEEDAIEDLDFTKAAFWVQVHNLPLELMTDENARNIGASLGELLEVDTFVNLQPVRKGFLRFRMVLNLLNPLIPGFTHHRLPKAPLWVQYMYERLSDYCYTCGRIGHISYDCIVEPRPPDHGRYGDKLKARSPKTSRVVQLIQSRSRSSIDRAIVPVHDRFFPELSSPPTANISQHFRQTQLSSSSSTQPSSSRYFPNFPDNISVSLSHVPPDHALINSSPFVNKSLLHVIPSSLQTTWPIGVKSLEFGSPNLLLADPNSQLVSGESSSTSNISPTTISRTPLLTNSTCSFFPSKNSTLSMTSSNLSTTPTACLSNLSISDTHSLSNLKPSSYSRKRFHPYPKPLPTKKPKLNIRLPSVLFDDGEDQNELLLSGSDLCKKAGVEGFNLPPPAQ
jgi:hypothetical protein